MIITSDIAKQYLTKYSNKNTRLSRDVRDGKSVSSNCLTKSLNLYSLILIIHNSYIE